MAHKQGGCEPQAKQEQLTRTTNKKDIRQIPSSFADLSLVRDRCYSLGVAPTVVDILLEKHPIARIKQQIEWLPARQPRDPAAMLVSAVQENWTQPAQYTPAQSAATWSFWQESERARHSEPSCKDVEKAERNSVVAPVRTHVPERKDITLPGTGRDAQEIWGHVLNELEMQMTRATYDMWLRGSHVVGTKEGGIVVQVRNEYAVEWLHTRWNVPIRRTLDAIAGQPTEVYFQVQQ